MTWAQEYCLFRGLASLEAMRLIGSRRGKLGSTATCHCRPRQEESDKVEGQPRGQSLLGVGWGAAGATDLKCWSRIEKRSSARRITRGTAAPSSPRTAGTATNSRFSTSIPRRLGARRTHNTRRTSSNSRQNRSRSALVLPAIGRSPGEEVESSPPYQPTQDVPDATLTHKWQILSLGVRGPQNIHAVLTPRLPGTSEGPR